MCSPIRLTTLIVVLMFFANPLQAAPSGLPDGRSAQVSDLSRFSGEIGYRHSENGPLTGLRLNLRVGPNSLLFIDAAKTSDSIDGVAAAAEVDRLMFDMAILLSPVKPLLDTGLQGYVAIGLARREDQQQVNVDGIRDPRLDKRRVDTDATIATGAVLPIRMGQLYAVVEHDRVASVSLGFRLLTE